MAIGLQNQIERRLGHQITTRDGALPWRENRLSQRINKTLKHRRERRRAKVDPECLVAYRRYWGYEY